MCGIIGMFPVTPEKGPSNINKNQQELAIRFLLGQTLLESKSRGPDATGVSIHLNNGEWAVLKQPVDADDFLLNIAELKEYPNQDPMANFRNLLRAWRHNVSQEGVRTACALGHVRKSTRGNTENSVNNHPVVVENTIVGVHNGTLDNDREIFEQLQHRKRAGVVDSEAIFHIHHALAPNEPPTLELMWEISRRLRGAFTTLHVHNQFPRIVGGLKKGRPLDLAYLHGLDLVVAVSNDIHLRPAVKRYNQFVATAGVDLPPIKRMDTKVISEGATTYNGQVLLYDLDKPFTTLGDWVQMADGPKYSEEAHEFDVAKAGTTTSSTTSSTAKPTAPSARTPEDMAAVEATHIQDMSEYEGEKKPAVVVQPKDPAPEEAESDDDTADDDNQGEGTVVFVEGAEGEKVVIPVSMLEGYETTDLDGQPLNMDAIYAEGELALEQLLEEDNRVALAAVGDDGEGITDVFDELEPAIATLVESTVEKPPKVFWKGVQKLLGTTAKAAYERAFPEGYLAGYGAAMEDVLQKLASGDHELGQNSAREDKVKARLKRATKHVANLKTLALAAMVFSEQCSSDGVDVTVSPELVDYASYINSEFDAASAVGLLNQGTTASDVSFLLNSLKKEEEDKSSEKNEEESDAKQPDEAAASAI